MMKAHLLLPLLALAAAPLCTAAETADAKAEAAAMKGYVDKKTNLNWGNIKALQTTLGQALENGVKSVNPKNVQAFVAKPANRLLVAQYLLACADEMTPPELSEAAKNEAVKQQNAADTALLKAELALENAPKAKKAEAAAKLKAAKAAAAGWAEQDKQPWTMEEFAASKHAKHLLPAVTGNLDWMTNILYTGECFAPGRTMAILAGVAEQHPEIMKDPMERDIATAVAVEWSKNAFPYYKALTRADYFIRNWKDNRLNAVFDNLSFFLRRMTCGAKVTGDHDTAQVPSMEWALENVHLPVEAYATCCWRCGYKGFSVYGENIQGPGYFAPFAGMYDEMGHLRGFQVGAVCGGLSHFGAYAAVANGVPASTMGEPGHCAFVLRVKDKWQPCYSLGWEHGLHYTPWRECYNFTTLHMATEAYQDYLYSQDSAVSNTYRALAHLFQKRNKDKAAVECLYNAVDAQPLNYVAWREYAAYLNAHHAADAAEWIQLNDAICTKLCPRYPEVAAQLLTKYVYPALSKNLKDEEKIIACIHLFWDSIRDKGPERWKAELFCDEQAKLFGEGKAENADTILKVYVCALSDVFNKADYAPIIMSWGNQKAEKAGGKLSAQMAAVSGTLLKAGSAGTTGIDLKDFNKALLSSAETSRDIESFQRIGKQMAQENGKLENPIRDVTELKGELISSGGMVFAKGSGKQDDLSMHWGVLEKVGGYIQSEPSEGTWIAVKLPRDSFVSGVVVVSPTFQTVYCDDMQLQISDTGEEGTWKDVGAPVGKCTRETRNHSFDFSGAELKTRYLRVIRKNGKDPLHIHCFHVYGRRAA